MGLPLIDLRISAREMIPTIEESITTGRRPMSWEVMSFLAVIKGASGGMMMTFWDMKPEVEAWRSPWILAFSTSRREMTPSSFPSPSTTGAP